MNKRGNFFFSFLFTATLGAASGHAGGVGKVENNSCKERVALTEKRIKKNFESLWRAADASVGVEFFMLVLKESDRMPASEMDSALYYTKLLAGMKKTSVDLSSHGLKFDAKAVDKLGKLIAELTRQQNCTVQAGL